MYWTVWAITFVLFLGKFVVPVFSIHLVVDRGIDPGLSGLILGAFGAGGVLSTVIGGMLSDRFGRVTMSVVTLSISSVVLVALAVEHPLPVLIPLLFCYGVSSFATIPILMAMIADIVPAPQRPRAYALSNWALNCGFAIGPALAVWLSSIQFAVPFLATAALTLVSTVAFGLIARRWSPEVTTGPADTVTAERGAWSTLMRDKLFLVFVIAFFGYAGMYTQFGANLPIVMRAEGLGAAEFSILLSVNGLVLVALQLPTLRLIERFPRMRLLIGSFLVTAVGYAGYIVSEQWWHFLLATLIWTVAELASYPIAGATVADMAPRRHRGAYQGMYTLIIAIAQMVTPAAGGLALSLGGPAGLWGACAVVLVASAVAMGLISKRIYARMPTTSGS
ncbi:MAG TPA: MFS transporter [Pseudolysinimonas sp.]|nr:MFS transporter [Pseudolysinimonas sp.]